MRGYINWLDSLPYKQDVMGSSPLPRTIIWRGSMDLQ